MEPVDRTRMKLSGPPLIFINFFFHTSPSVPSAIWSCVRASGKTDFFYFIFRVLLFSGRFALLEDLSLTHELQLSLFRLFLLIIMDWTERIDMHKAKQGQPFPYQANGRRCARNSNGPSSFDGNKGLSERKLFCPLTQMIIVLFRVQVIIRQTMGRPIKVTSVTRSSSLF